MNKRIVMVLSVLSLLFLSLIVYLTWFELAEKDRISSNSYNQRQWAYEEEIKRGRIYDSTGVLLADTDEAKNRVYPHGRLYSHVIGYHSRVYGRSGIELAYNNMLLGQGKLSEMFALGGERGYDLTLTLHHDLQSLASQRLGSRNGAVVALDPKTGEVLVMVSKPDFNPTADALADNWAQLVEDENSPLLPRATSGLYAPGSTFKIVTAAAAIEAGMGDRVITDEGKVIIGGHEFENQKEKAYGEITVTEGFAVSSNVVFCTLGADLGFATLQATAERFGFTGAPQLDLPAEKNRFPQKSADAAYTAALSIGQADILVTPLQMAMTAAAVANDGVMMRPFVAKRAVNESGTVVWENRPVTEGRAMSAETATKIEEMMIETVKSGTGTSGAIRGVAVAGKTGTAENERTEKDKNAAHTWFVAYAPAEDPQIAVAVMMEYSGGSGSGNCAPIARDLIAAYLGR